MSVAQGSSFPLPPPEFVHVAGQPAPTLRPTTWEGWATDTAPWADDHEPPTGADDSRSPADAQEFAPIDPPSEPPPDAHTQPPSDNQQEHDLPEPAEQPPGPAKSGGPESEPVSGPTPAEPDTEPGFEDRNEEGSRVEPSTDSDDKPVPDPHHEAPAEIKPETPSETGSEAQTQPQPPAPPAPPAAKPATPPDAADELVGAPAGSVEIEDDRAGAGKSPELSNADPATSTWDEFTVTLHRPTGFLGMRTEAFQFTGSLDRIESMVAQISSRRHLLNRRAARLNRSATEEVKWAAQARRQSGR